MFLYKENKRVVTWVTEDKDEDVTAPILSQPNVYNVRRGMLRTPVH